MAADTSVALLSLPSGVLDRVSQPAVRDTIQYFSPDLVVVPGPRSVQAHAIVRNAVGDIPILHPQLGRSGDRIQQYRYTARSGRCEATETALSLETNPTHETSPPPETIDLIAVQHRDVLDRLATELETGERQTGSGGATFLIVPQLTVDWEPTTLTTTLPSSDELAAISAALPEPVTVLAGGQPAAYAHEWDLPHAGESVSVPIIGLGATGQGSSRFSQHSSRFAQYTCTIHGGVAPEPVDADQFGLSALNGVGSATATRLRNRGCETTGDVRDLAVSELTDLPGIGRQTAQTIHAHAAVIDSGDPLVLTNSRPVKTRDDRPPLCLDIETDGLSPTIIWQFGVYDPAIDRYRSFVEKQQPTNPKPVLEAFMTWFIATHSDRTVVTWNGHRFDYRHITHFLHQYLPEYVDAWDDIWTYDLYKWAVRDGNALLPGRTNKLDHVARALGYDSSETGLSGAQTAAAYQAFKRNPDTEPDWDRHETYCEDDCRALYHVYRSITNAPRRDTTDSGAGGADGTQAGLTDFS